MYSYEERIKAVQLLLQYDMSYATVMRELGYPSRRTLVDWYTEYTENNDLHKSFIKKSRFNVEDRQKAVTYYLEHGKCVSRTVRILGYPSRPTLDKWIEEIAPEQKKRCRSGGSRREFAREEKEKAVVSLCSRNKSAKKIAAEIGVSREVLYNWKRQLLNKGCENPMPKKTKPLTSSSGIESEGEIADLLSEKSHLKKQVDDLQKEIYRLQLERDILETSAEIIKKGQGINPQQLTNKGKSNLIDALREKYPLNELLEIVSIPKSSYFYQRKAHTRPDKYATLRTEVKDVFTENKGRYGYRRVHAAIKNKGVVISEKVVRRIMKEEELVAPYRKKRKYSSYKGEISPAVENIVSRDFHANAPNTKWLTDLTEFHIPAGKVYLSPIIDCFDGMAVSWTIGTSPDAELVNTMLDDAICDLSEGDHPVVHSDRGCHYRWPGWISRMEKAQLTRSMSQKGCSPDNSACEGFFGRLKNEMFYCQSWQGVYVDQFIKELDCYIRWYNEKRIKMSLGAMSPLSYRRSLGLTA